jgi:hypothetical protein
MIKLRTKFPYFRLFSNVPNEFSAQLLYALREQWFTYHSIASDGFLQGQVGILGKTWRASAGGNLGAETVESCKSL